MDGWQQQLYVRYGDPDVPSGPAASVLADGVFTAMPVANTVMTVIGLAAFASGGWGTWRI